MILGTERLIILTIKDRFFDEDVRTIITCNGIFLKKEGISVERITRNPKLIRGLGEPVGLISIGANGWIDYVVSEEHQGRGYATEALEKVKEFALRNNVEPFLVIEDDNEASRKVAEKCGFTVTFHGENQKRYYVKR